MPIRIRTKFTPNNISNRRWRWRTPTKPNRYCDQILQMKSVAVTQISLDARWVVASCVWQIFRAETFLYCFCRSIFFPPNESPIDNFIRILFVSSEWCKMKHMKPWSFWLHSTSFQTNSYYVAAIKCIWDQCLMICFPFKWILISSLVQMRCTIYDYPSLPSVFVKY